MVSGTNNTGIRTWIKAFCSGSVNPALKEKVYLITISTRNFGNSCGDRYPFSVGGVKEKQYLETLENGAIRFQGELRDANGTTYLDRTTLVPMDNGNILQLIEISPAGADRWREVFRGEYKPGKLKE